MSPTARLDEHRPLHGTSNLARFPLYRGGWWLYATCDGSHDFCLAVAILTRPDPRTPRRELCPSSSAQPWAILFHPPTHRLLCNRLPETCAFPSKHRLMNAFLQGAAWINPYVRAHLFLSPRVGRWEPPATCERCTAPLLRSLFRRWRDAMSEGPFGRSPGRTKLAEPSSSGTVRFHLSLKQWLHVQPPRAQGLTRLIHSFLGCALGEQRKLPSLPIHYFAEPSTTESCG